MDNKDNHWKLSKSCQESADLKQDDKNINNPNNSSHNNNPRVPRLVIQVKKVNLFPNLPNLNPATNANNNQSSSWQSLLRPSILTDAFKKPESHENPSNPPLVLQEHSNSAHRNGTPNTLGSTVSAQNGSKRPKKRALSNPDIPYHDSSKRSHHKSSNSEASKQCGLNLVPATIPTIAGKSNMVIDGPMARKLMRRYSAPIKPFCRGDEKQLTNQAKNRASVIKFTQSTREASAPENLSIRLSVPNAPSISSEQIVRQEQNVPDIPIVPDEPMGDQPMKVDLVTVDNDLASTKYFLCEACYTSFKGEEVFRQHLQDHISIDQPLNCNPCNVSFQESDQLIRHQETQSHIQTVGLLANRHLPNSNENHRPFVCTDCNISYSISEKLSKHLRSKGHLIRLEAENKIPYGMCKSLELLDIDFESIDDTDSSSCLASLLRLAESMYAIGGQMPREPKKVQKPQDLPIELKSKSSSSLSILLRPPPPLLQINQSNGSNASDNCGKVSNLTAFTSMGKATNPTENVSGSNLSKSNISFVDSIKTSSDLAKRKREPDRRHRYNLRRSSSSNSAINETTESSPSTLSSSSLPLATSPPSEQGNPTISSESLMLSAALSKTSLSSAPHTPATLPVDKLKLPTLFAIPSTSSAPAKPLVPPTELPAPPPLQKITPPSNVLPIETIPRKSASMHRPTCEYCNKVLNTLKALQVHYFIEHPDKLSHYN